MKKDNYIELLGYKIKAFVTLGFCILTFLTILCIVFLLLFVFDVRVTVDLDNNVCGNINSVLVSITTGYLVSYLVYLLTVHIPNYTQIIVNDRIISYYLSSYRDRLLYSFGGLMYILEKKNHEKNIEIPEITKLFESQKYQDIKIVEIIQGTYNLESNNNLLLAKDFERLEDAFQNLLNLNALYKGRFSNKIYQLQISGWSDLLFTIKDEIRNPKTNFSILNYSETKSLIKQNFDLTNESIQINTLINSD